MSKKSFEIARDLKRVRQTVATMLSQLYSRLDALGRQRKRTQGRISQLENELAQLLRSAKALQDEVASLRDENVARRLRSLEAGRHGGGSGVTDHGALTGLVPDDDHTQYQKESEKGATSGYASLDGSTLVPVAEMATGTPESNCTSTVGFAGLGEASQAKRPATDLRTVPTSTVLSGCSSTPPSTDRCQRFSSML